MRCRPPGALPLFRHFYADERPGPCTWSFPLDREPVTNLPFARLSLHRYRTWAERGLPAGLSGADPTLLVPASRFQPTRICRHPQSALGGGWCRSRLHIRGPESDLTGWLNIRGCMFHCDARLMRLACKRLPTAADFNCARGALVDNAYAWVMLAPHGATAIMGGMFPCSDATWSCTNVRPLDSPSKGRPSNDRNVWEWTADWYGVADAATQAASPCCAPRNPRGGDEAGSIDPRDGTHRFGRKVLKGGSHLCAENYCRLYRPAARHAQPVDSSTSHIGFRCAADA